MQHTGARYCFCASMILIRLTFFIAVAIFLVGCEDSPKVPNTTQKNYPVIIKDSTDRRAKAEREWRRMLDAYQVQQTPPDLHPIIYTPRSLLGVTGGIKIMAAKPEPGSEVIALREAVKGFVDRWRDLLGADLASISLVSGDQSSDIQRLIYRQANYPFHIAGNYGEMVAVLSADGRLMQLDDRFIPIVELPARPQIEREVAARRVVGRTFTYSDIAGREQRTQVTNPADVSVKQAVVFPIERGDVIEVHLAWEIVAGSSLSWTVYIDAINGEELKVIQNFQT
jgi:hypothetical protein